jgi:putative PEP-CTERM system TPR-repeat lipoprotein
MSRSVQKKTIAASVSAILLLAAALNGCSRGQTAASLVADAKQYQQKGDDKAALIQLKNALAKSPDDGEVRLLLAKLYIDTGDILSAEKEARKALSLGIAPERAMPALARTLLAEGKFQKLLDETQAASAKTPPELLTLRGHAYLALGQAAKARESFALVLQQRADDTDALLGLARLSLLQNDIDGGVRLSDQALAKHPNSADAWLFKADLLRGTGKFSESLDAYDHVLALKPNHRSAHLEKATLEIRAGKFDAAKADILAAQKVTPNSIPVVFAQASLDFAQGKNPAALEGIQKVLRVAPEHMPAILLAGAVEAALGSTEQAERHLRKYLEANPSSQYARMLLVSTLLKGGRPTEALAALGPALKDGQQDPRLLALAGQAYLQNREFDKAAEYFGKASALAPQQAQLHTSLALSKLGQGDDARAVSELEMSTKLDSKLIQANVVLVMTELRLKHLDKALAAALAFEKERPQDPMAPNLKGGVLLAMNQPAEARASFEKALALQPTYFPAVANLAQLDVKEKKPDAARQRLESLLEKDKKNLDAQIALAALANSQGHPEQATASLEHAVADHPAAIAPAIQLATAYLRGGQKQKALTLARKLQTANAANPDLLELLATTQLANDDPTGALESYSQLVNVVPKSAAAHFRLAAVHQRLKNDAAAAQDLKRALELQPDFLQAQLAQVDLAMRAHDVPQALAIAHQIQLQRRKDPVGFALEGDLQLAQKNAPLALQAFEKAYALAPAPELMIKLHGAMLLSGKEKQAELRIAQWQKDHPGDAVVGMYLAESSLAKHQYKVAIPQLQAILKQNGKNIVALNNLAWAYQQDKDARAGETAEQAYLLAPGNPAVLDTLGWILIEQGNTARGLPLVQKALALAPADPGIRFHLAVGLNKSGDKASARKELEQVLAKRSNFDQIEAARALLKQL